MTLEGINVTEYLSPKCFGIVHYISIVVQLLCCVVLCSVTSSILTNEDEKFSCSIDYETSILMTTTRRKQEEENCLKSYKGSYYPSIPLYGFVLMTMGLPLLVAVIYSLMVRSRVDEIATNLDRPFDNDDIDSAQASRKTVYVLQLYLIQLVLKATIGIIFTFLQHLYIYFNGFVWEFDCKLSNSSRNITTALVTCANPTAFVKQSCSIALSIVNVAIVFILICEIVYICSRLLFIKCNSSHYKWNSDKDFVIEYFLRKRYANLRCSQPLPNRKVSSAVTIDSYKQQICSRALSHDINYIRMHSDINDLYIDVIIHTERARHKFSKSMKRHEIYDVYQKVPTDSTRLNTIVDMFKPNQDTKGKTPRSILVIGRPGIGKTVLTEKVLRDWAEEIDDFYLDKFAFHFKLRWLNAHLHKSTNMTLFEFLLCGTKLRKEDFQCIYDQIICNKLKTVFIFDGLDEWNVDNPTECFDESFITPNDHLLSMSAFSWFIKLALGEVIEQSTVVVTTRPTAENFYSKLRFDRNVEILGFTIEKVEQYVGQFCKNNGRSNQETALLKSIKSSSELSNLCYIPVNCFIVCVTLSGCLDVSETENCMPPSTITELYTNALHYLEKYEQNRNAKFNPMTREELKNLQKLAFDGMTCNKLTFDSYKFNEMIKKSCLLNSLPNSIFSSHVDVCFIHLTIQEFLAAKHVTENLNPQEIREFILKHISNGRWHLVLQFIAGLLGKKDDVKEYLQCISTFAEYVVVTNGVIKISRDQTVLLKCLREVDDKELIRHICETTVLNDVTQLRHTTVFSTGSARDFAAVAFVCNQMKNLASAHLWLKNQDCINGVLNLLKRRSLREVCVYSISSTIELDSLLKALIKRNSKANHKHENLISLSLYDIFQQESSYIKKFFESNCASHLKSLTLTGIKLDVWGSLLFEAINDGRFTELEDITLSDEIFDKTTKHQFCCKICDALLSKRCQLKSLKLRNCNINEEAAESLFESLKSENCELTSFSLSNIKLTSRCVPMLTQSLQNKHCRLTTLELNFDLSDVGAKMFFEGALTNMHCKLQEVKLDDCSLTYNCISTLCDSLKSKHCQVSTLSLGRNKIYNEGAILLFEKALTNKNCKISKLNLSDCHLTNQCVPILCNAIQDENNKLTSLSLSYNDDITDEGVQKLFAYGLPNKNCSLAELFLVGCSLTDGCVPELSNALRSENNTLNSLSLSHNKGITDAGVNILFESGLRSTNCKLTGLRLDGCSLTNRCLPTVCKVLQNEYCQLTYLNMMENEFDQEGIAMLNRIIINKSSRLAWLST